jgi:hypothetical protein
MKRVSFLVFGVMVAVLAIVATAQAQGCSHCFQCSADPDDMETRDYGGEILWLYNDCYDYKCEDAIGCFAGAAVDAAALDELIAAAARIDGSFRDLADRLVRSGARMTFVKARSGVLVEGCAGRALAFIPLADTGLLTQLTSGEWTIAMPPALDAEKAPKAAIVAQGG